MINEENKLLKYRLKIAERNKHIEHFMDKINTIHFDIMHLARLNSLDEEKVERLEKKLNQKT
jgi:hypothetical protein